MQKICKISGKEPDEFFSFFRKTLKGKITRWDYFVNWKKVITNVDVIEMELNLLNSLIGKKNIAEAAESLFLEYPSCVKAIPSLLAIRDRSVQVLVDVSNFVYENFDFSCKKPSGEDARMFSSFILNSGIGELLADRRIKNLVDYVIGVEVGLDTNARKNRGGSLMESIVETFVAKDCLKNNAVYLPQATACKIRSEWQIEIEVDKSQRQIDFAINKDGKLYFIETNFYGGGGSKLKATATEYTSMNTYWNTQGIEFIWVTDGAGWYSTLRPLREYFDKTDYLVNLEMLKLGYLSTIIQHRQVKSNN